MEENFDWLSSNTETMKEALGEILDIEFIEILKDVEGEGQNRDTIHILLLRRTKDVHFELYGFDMNLLDRLLNQIPFYEDGKVKEPYTKEMREFIIDRDNYQCRLCHSSWNGLQCHHIEPQGSAKEDNLITLCNKCHDALHKLLRNKGYNYQTHGRELWRRL